MNEINVINLGCKVNQCESDGIGKKLAELGFSVGYELAPAEVFVINTCAVTMEAERKSRQCVSRALKLNQNAKIFVIGCASGNDTKQFLNAQNVVYLNGAQNKIDVILAVKAYFEQLTNNNPARSCNSIENINFERNCEAVANENSVNRDTNVVVKSDTSCEFQEMTSGGGERTRYYVKIQDGCNNFCAYCIVPYLRGRSRSRDVKHIISECESAEKQTNEIVLTGINLSAFGDDNGSSLCNLLYELRDISCNIRLGSLEVNVITDDFLRAAAGLKSFCPHFHLSLQSAADGVLAKMNRKYTASEYMEKVELIRKYFPSAAITTDIIVGFPTETEEDFKEGLQNIEKIHFADAHVFSYSKREGTVAAKYKQINGKIIDERIKRLNEVVSLSRSAYLQSNIGKTLRVIIEDVNIEEGAYSEGYSENYLRVRVPNSSKVFDKSMANVEVLEEKGGILYGKVV